MDEEEADEAALTAIRAVQAYLRETYIVDECRASPSLGCVSCEAVALERGLETIANDIYENRGWAPPP